MRILLAALLAIPLAAQTARFEVAALKLSPPPEGNLININLGTLRNGRLMMGNVTLGDMMKFAYGLTSDTQLVEPDWSSMVRFDVEALAEPGTALEQMRPMMQQLLAERLHLAIRREQRTASHLALVAATGGMKMAAAQEGAVPARPQVRGRINHPAMPMLQLASLLSRFESQTVIDLTGLSGSYEVKLEWAPDTVTALPDAPPPDRPSLYAAVQEQLGLRLESRRGPIDVLVVEQALRVPEAN